MIDSPAHLPTCTMHKVTWPLSQVSASRFGLKCSFVKCGKILRSRKLARRDDEIFWIVLIEHKAFWISAAAVVESRLFCNAVERALSTFCVAIKSETNSMAVSLV